MNQCILLKILSQVIIKLNNDISASDPMLNNSSKPRQGLWKPKLTVNTVDLASSHFPRWIAAI